ncbi:MAG: hypothetical protein M1368_07885, partial [Thaumarchaeota archaeon]|nr:hypothetical protein [Nitrososphaerota archaeon]
MQTTFCCVRRIPNSFGHAEKKQKRRSYDLKFHFMRETGYAAAHAGHIPTHSTISLDRERRITMLSS